MICLFTLLLPGKHKNIDKTDICTLNLPKNLCELNKLHQTIYHICREAIASMFDSYLKIVIFQSSWSVETQSINSDTQCKQQFLILLSHPLLFFLYYLGVQCMVALLLAFFCDR